MPWNPWQVGKPENPGMAIILPAFETVDDEAALADSRRLVPVVNEGWVDQDPAGLKRRFRLNVPVEVQTVDNTPTVLYESGDLTLEPDCTAYRVEADVWGVRPVTADTSYCFIKEFSLFTAVGGVLTFRGTYRHVPEIRSGGGINVVIGADGTNKKVQVVVTGDAAHPMSWAGLISIVRLDRHLVA